MRVVNNRFLEHDWFASPLPENVTIGERSWLYSAFAFLHCHSRRGVQIGHDSGLYAGTFFDLGPNGEVRIGNYCALVGAIISSNQRIVIGDYAFISHEVVIADSWIAQPAANEDPRPSSAEELGVEIGPNAWIGTGAILLSGAKIGEGAIVGAQTLVNFAVPDFAIVAGSPAQIRGYVKG
ncbi:MAG TPA: acyltransferase [bacterium]|nr:acyltransferase [bacterium]